MAKTSRGPSMHDVAARAGVSHQTVSRVLNDFPGIRPETRDRVVDAIEELGYRRNLAARALVTGRTQTVGMIGPVVPDIGPLSTLHAIERAARAVDLHTLMTSAEHTEASLRDGLDFLVGRGVDAIAFVAEREEMVDILKAAQVGVPVVHLLTGGEVSGLSASIDQRAGVRLAMGHLMGLGHTRIQHVAGPGGVTEARIRREEYLSIVREAGLEPLEIIEGDWTPDSGFAAGEALSPDATAVFCANDEMAYGVLHALAVRGRRVPEDVSIVGFDDHSAACHTLPPLTTVRQDFEAVGRLAVEIMTAAVDGRAPEEPRYVAPELIVRESATPLAPR